MTGLLMLAGMAVIISVMSTTRESRREARDRLRPHNWKFWLAAALIWGALLIPYK